MNEEKKSVLEELFGGGRLSLDELLIKAGEAGVEIGDVGEVRREYGGRLHEERTKSALERELERAGAKDKGIVTKVIDFSRVTSDEDGVHGLREQIDALRESSPYLFAGAEDEKRAREIPVSGYAHTHGALPDEDRLSDAEFYRRRFKS